MDKFLGLSYYEHNYNLIDEIKQNNLKENYKILIELDSISIVTSENIINFHPCRLKAVNELYDKGHEIIIFTTIEEEKKRYYHSSVERVKIS